MKADRPISRSSRRPCPATAVPPPDPVPPLRRLDQISREVDVGEFSVSEIVHRPGTALGDHRHACAQLCCTIEGSFTEMSEGDIAVYDAGTTTVRPPEMVHRNLPSDVPARAVIVDLTPRAFEPFAGFFPRSLPPVQARSRTTGTLPLQILHELRSGDACSVFAMRGFVWQLLSLMGRAALAAARDETPVWLQRAIGIVETSYRRPISLADIAALVERHPTGVAREFRRATGKSVGERIRELRFEFAVKRLTATSDSLCEVADAAGYCDQAHFTREFSRRAGVSPAEFRRRRAIANASLRAER